MNEWLSEVMKTLAWRLALAPLLASSIGSCQSVPAPLPSPAASGSVVASPTPVVTTLSSPEVSPTTAESAFSTATPQPTYRDYADWATQTLLRGFYHDAGWRTCALDKCKSVNRDWGADSLTYTLYLRWRTTHDPSLVTFFEGLLSTAPQYPPPCHGL